MKPNCFICVDIEAAGPNPSNYSLLSIGAVTLAPPVQEFYAELKPIHDAQTEEAAEVHGLSLAELQKSGEEAQAAMQRFADWVEEACQGEEPVFVAFNAPFDWMFTADYFHRFLGRNPFGHRALDIKALYMGMQGVDWKDTSHHQISKQYQLSESLPHHALEDARQEADLFAAMLKQLSEMHPETLEE